MQASIRTGTRRRPLRFGTTRRTARVTNFVATLSEMLPEG